MDHESVEDSILAILALLAALSPLLVCAFFRRRFQTRCRQLFVLGHLVQRRFQATTAQPKSTTLPTTASTQKHLTTKEQKAHLLGDEHPSRRPTQRRRPTTKDLTTGAASTSVTR
jgi:single-stranded DNA-binding protein